MEGKRRYNKVIVCVIIFLFSCVAISPIVLGKEILGFHVNNSGFIILEGPPNNGSLSGYVKDTDMNPIEGARVKVSFHGTYEENYTNENGFYHVTNIPLCFCMKNASCYKPCYAFEWVMLTIVENTTHDFILNSSRPPSEPIIKGPNKINSISIKPRIKSQKNYPPGTYDFTFKATDPDGDDIRFHIDWGDGNTEITEFVHSGEDLIISHNFEEIGEYSIRAMAEDICGLFGPWGTIPIIIIKSRDCGCFETIKNFNWEDFCNAVSDLAQMIQNIVNEQGGIFKLLTPLFVSLISIWMIFCWLR
jgi:hypothetical protein